MATNIIRTSIPFSYISSSTRSLRPLTPPLLHPIITKSQKCPLPAKLTLHCRCSAQGGAETPPEVPHPSTPELPNTPNDLPELDRPPLEFETPPGFDTPSPPDYPVPPKPEIPTSPDPDIIVPSPPHVPPRPPPPEVDPPRPPEVAPQPPPEVVPPPIM